MSVCWGRVSDLFSSRLPEFPAHFIQVWLGVLGSHKHRGALCVLPSGSSAWTLWPRSSLQWWVGFPEQLLLRDFHMCNPSKWQERQWHCQQFSCCVHSVQNTINKRQKRPKIQRFQTCHLFLCLLWYLCRRLVLRKLAKLSWQGGALLCKSFPGLFLAEEYSRGETGQWAGLARNCSCKIEAEISQDGSVL